MSEILYPTPIPIAPWTPDPRWNEVRSTRLNMAG